MKKLFLLPLLLLSIVVFTSMDTPESTPSLTTIEAFVKAHDLQVVEDQLAPIRHTLISTDGGTVVAAVVSKKLNVVDPPCQWVLVVPSGGGQVKICKECYHEACGCVTYTECTGTPPPQL